jgi:hypothetical protein
MSASKAPTGLGAGGRSLWKSITDDHDLDATQLVQLTEACRAKDRLDKLDSLLRGDVDTWVEVYVDPDGNPVSLRIDAALQRANDTANLLKQLLAALRLPDSAGKRPQRRGPRGAQAPTVPGGKVSSLDRARAKRSS